jgi:two-component system, chemotaxis family, chemotaxis protein CheY
MAKDDFSEIRILLVARKGAPTQIMHTVFGVAGISQIVDVDETRRAVELLCTEHFHAVFTEGSPVHDRMPFALAARRLPLLLNPMIPIFALFPQARKRDVETARDLGVHDVICRPVSPRTIATKLRAVLAAPRPFIAAPNFFGPDRRSKARTEAAPDHERRGRAARKTKVTVSLI